MKYIKIQPVYNLDLLSKFGIKFIKVNYSCTAKYLFRESYKSIDGIVDTIINNIIITSVYEYISKCRSRVTVILAYFVSSSYTVNTV